jgi:hypothetical protein
LQAGFFRYDDFGFPSRKQGCRVRLAAEASIPLAPDARQLARGLARALDRQGWRSLLEFPLASGRRADLIAIDEGGRFLIVEIKTTAGDYRADRKWREYLDYCDFFAFAVPEGFPVSLLPPEVGLIMADAYDAVSHRPAMPAPAPLASARRRQMLIRFSRAGADRLRRLLDPETGIGGPPGAPVVF